MKGPELRSLCAEKGLGQQGNKADLVDRLLRNGVSAPLLRDAPASSGGLNGITKARTPFRGVKGLKPLDEVCEPVERFSSGALGFDLALGGGWPRGRIVEVYGPESSGKTTVALSAIAEVQRSGGLAVFIDAEHALDPNWAQTLGVDTKNMYFKQPDSGEDALETVYQVLETGEAELIVVDSVSQLTPRVEIERGMDQETIGQMARMMSKALRKISPAASKANCTVLFINQIRFKIGGYGNPETTSGGNALKYNASVRVDVRRKELVKQSGADPTGLRIQAKVVKNKTAPPFRTAMLDLSFEDGICREASLLEVAADTGAVTKKGAYYYFGDGEDKLTLGQGQLRACEFLRANPDMRAKIEALVRSSTRNGHASGWQVPAAEEEAAEGDGGEGVGEGEADEAEEAEENERDEDGEN